MTTLAEDQAKAANQGKPGYDVLGDPVAPAAPAPISRTVDAPATDPNAAAAESFLGTFTPPETAAQIAERKRQQSSGLIDNINKTYDDEVASKRKAGDERVAMDNAVSVLSGLTGSTEANRTRTNVNDANSKEVQAVNNKRMLDLSSVYTRISADADAEARQQLQDATKSAEDIVARRAASQGKALESVKTMAAGGLVDFESFKNSPQNKNVYDYAAQAAGGEDALRSLFAVNRPKDQIVGTPTRIGNAYVQAYQNPITGAVKYEQIPLPVDFPTEYTHFERIGKDNNTLIAVPDNWDGDPSKIKTIYSGAGAGTGGGGGAGGYNGEFAQTIELAGGLAGSVYAQKALKDQLKSAIAAKDYKSAYQGIVSATAGGLSGENKTKFETPPLTRRSCTTWPSPFRTIRLQAAKWTYLKAPQTTSVSASACWPTIRNLPQSLPSSTARSSSTAKT
jgi:hypothetical protein